MQPSQQPREKSAAIVRFFTGAQPRYQFIPINSFFFARDTIIVSHFTGAGNQEAMVFPIASLLPRAQTGLDLGHQQLYIFDHNISRRTFYLGTDRYGRDVLSRLLVGTRVGICVGFVSAALSLSIAILLGVLAGYYRGWIDVLATYVTNTVAAIPTFLLAFAITLSIGHGLWQIFIAIGLSMWAGATRLIRRQVVGLRESEYVQAARILGRSHLRIILRHILPNIAGPLLVVAASNFGTAILIEAGLSFLGIGVQPPIPSWGLMIREHYDFLFTNHSTLVLIPGLAILILVVALNILSNALRECFKSSRVNAGDCCTT